MYFTAGGVIPFGVLVYFVLVADRGAIAKVFAFLLFVSTFFIQGALAASSVELIPMFSQPMFWMAIRIGFALVLLLMVKMDELPL